MQQVPQRSLIVVSERIPWTVPVPGHHTTRQGGRTTKGREEGWKEKRKKNGRKRSKEAEVEVNSRARRKKRSTEGEGRVGGKQQKTGGGGTGYATFLLTTASNQIKGKPDKSYESQHYSNAVYTFLSTCQTE